MDYNDVIMNYYSSSDSLMHHGILGMKWGVRRFQNKDGSLTRAGQLRYGSGDSKGNTKSLVEQANSTKNEDHHAKDSNASAVKLAAKMALHVATLPIAPASSIEGLIRDSARLGQALHANVKSKNFEAERLNEKVDPKTGFRVKSKDYSPEEDLKRVNPEFKNFNTNTKSNCMLCTMTYDLRRRGYDVTAQKASIGYAVESVKEFYPKAKIEHVGNTWAKREDGTRMSRRDLSQQTISALSKQGNGARGNIMVGWNLGGGHSMVYEVKDGKVRILDGQNGKVINNPNKILRNVCDVSYARLDNVEPNYKKMKEVCR